MVVVDNIIIQTFASTMSVDNIFVSGLGRKECRRDCSSPMDTWLIDLMCDGVEGCRATVNVLLSLKESHSRFLQEYFRSSCS